MTAKNRKVKVKKLNLKKATEMQSYAMLLPSLIGTSAFVVFPLLWVIRWSVFRYDGMFDAVYVGLYNFQRVFLDTSYWSSVINTFILAFGKLSIELPLALVLAVLLNARIAAKNTYRVIYFLPTIISVAIIGVIFSFIFASYNGVVNNLLLELRIMKIPVSWFSGKWTALSILGIASIWQNFGLNMIFFLTGLQSIPSELYECAEIDGANKFTQFIHITIPMLAPVIQVIVMIATLGSLKITELVLVLTGGRPAGTTEVMMTYTFNRFFTSTTAPNYGYASALAVVSATILGILTVIYLKYTNQKANIL